MTEELLEIEFNKLDQTVWLDAGNGLKFKRAPESNNLEVALQIGPYYPTLVLIKLEHAPPKDWHQNILELYHFYCDSGRNDPGAPKFVEQLERIFPFLKRSWSFPLANDAKLED